MAVENIKLMKECCPQLWRMGAEITLSVVAGTSTIREQQEHKKQREKARREI